MKNKKELVKKCKKRSYTSTHSKDIIDLAVDAIKMKRLSSYEAEKVFGIPRRTLLDKVHNKHPKRPGCPAKLSDEEEANIVKVLIAAANYGSPLTLLDLRIVVYRYLEGNGRLSIFDNKLPGKKWAYLFVKRNKSKLSYRVIQNIKRSRAEKSPNEMNEYFANLRSSLEGVPIENILNYDETNLSDNPGVQKCLFRRGVKYPERVLNHTKGSTSIMFAITAGGECLPPYVVYKAEHLYTQWTLNGPKGARFNRSKSGWFDSNLFEDWFETIILPWAKNKPGKKVIIGDNLASHISYKIVTYCEENDICFVFLPPNSSHITQPLDVCYFGPLKKLWREILTQYKMKNPREATIHKGHFPDLLKKLLEKLNGKTNNIISGFKSTGIAPFNPDKVISKLPGSDQSEMTYTIDNALLDWLKETRSADPCKKVRCKKLNVPPGKSICSSDVEHLLTQRKEKKKRQKKNNSGTPQMDSDSLLQSSLVRKNPDSLKKMCIGKVNAYLSSIVQNADESSSHILKIQSLGELSRNDEANVSFIGNIPECLQTNKPKIKINSNVIFKADSSLNIQQKKQGKTNSKQDRTKIVRSALHMKLVPIKQEKIAEEKKILQEITQETDVEMTETVDRKPQNQVKKRKINNTETNKAKKKMQKHKSKIRTNRRSRSSSSLSNDFDLSLADTEDSEYETMEDFINYYQNEEQENIEPPYGISDIEYSTDHNKLKEDSWILAQFVTKKSKKHYVGKIISIKDNVPEVKFVRKVKNSKFNKGTVFTYPAVEDICNVTHSDDVVMVLPEPKISRRGQIIFNMNFRKYNIQ